MRFRMTLVLGLFVSYISSSCALQNRPYTATEIKEELLKIRQKNDLVEFVGDRKATVRLEEVPPLVYEFGSLSFYPQEIAFIGLFIQGGRLKAQYITHEGRMYIGKVGEGEFKYDRGSFQPSSVQQIVFQPQPRMKPEEFHLLYLRNGDLMSVAFDTPLTVTDGWTEKKISLQNVLKITFDCGVYGRLQQSKFDLYGEYVIEPNLSYIDLQTFGYRSIPVHQIAKIQLDQGEYFVDRPFVVEAEDLLFIPPSLDRVYLYDREDGPKNLFPSLTRISHKLSANLNNLSRHLRPQWASPCRLDNVLSPLWANLSQHLVHLHPRFCEKCGLTRISHKLSANPNNLSRHLCPQWASPCHLDNVLSPLWTNLTQHLVHLHPRFCEKYGLKKPSYFPDGYPFYIDAHEVTNREYLQFVKATDHPVPLHWTGGNIPQGQEDNPVVNVSFQDAKEYARWAGKRLPTQDEWNRFVAYTKCKSSLEHYTDTKQSKLGWNLYPILTNDHTSFQCVKDLE